jgi:hypothetical protein
MTTYPQNSASTVLAEIDRQLGRVKAQVKGQPKAPEFGKLFTYSDAQRHVFFDSSARGRIRIFPKGRRAGFTRGAAHAAIEWVNAGLSVLWGDTIQTNLKAYFELYFKPAIKSKGLTYHWNAQDKVLTIGKGFMHMRSAQNPENWEGFGYHKIILNEAGIILEDRQLFENTVRPMLLDFADSELIAIGKPKGRNLFYELFQKALAGEQGYYTPASHMPPQHGQTHFAYTALDNPWLNRDNSAAEIAMMGPGIKEQEGLGQFVDDQRAFRVIPRAWVTAAMERSRTTQKPLGAPNAVGIDPSRGGADETALAPRWGLWFGAIETFAGSDVPDGAALASLVLVSHPDRGWAIAPETHLIVDIIGDGSSGYDHIRPSHQANTYGFKNSYGTDITDKQLKAKLTNTQPDPNRAAHLKFRNLRAASYWAIREILDPSNNLEAVLPFDLELADDLCEPCYKITSAGIQIESKDEVKARLGRSPGKGDALVMAAWTDLPKRQTTKKPNSSSEFMI